MILIYPRIPLIAIINYDLSIDLDDFKSAFYYPDSDTFENFWNYFLLEYGQFTPIYQMPEYLLLHIQAVSQALKPTIDKLYATLSLEYNPIHNYDRTETGYDIRTPDLATSENNSGSKVYAGGTDKSFSRTENVSMTGGETRSKSGGHNEVTEPHSTERKVSADNVGTYHPAEQTIDNGETKTITFNNEQETQTYNQRGDATTEGITESETYNSRQDTETNTRTATETGTETNTHNFRAYGNIGVTTTQEMIKSEREIDYYNFIEDVSRLYGEQLCILLY